VYQTVTSSYELTMKRTALMPTAGILFQACSPAPDARNPSKSGSTAAEMTVTDTAAAVAGIDSLEVRFLVSY
jgi:hypothetical protein